MPRSLCLSVPAITILSTLLRFLRRRKAASPLMPLSALLLPARRSARPVSSGPRHWKPEVDDRQDRPVRSDSRGAPLSRVEPAIRQCRCDGSTAEVTVAPPATQPSIISTTCAQAAFLAGALHCDVCSDEITADNDIRALTREQPGVGAPMSALFFVRRGLARREARK